MKNTSLCSKTPFWARSFAYVFCCITGGTGWFAIRHSIGEGAYPMLAAASIRYSGAATLFLVLLLTLLAFGLELQQRITREQIFYLGVSGLATALGVIPAYHASRHLPPGLVAVIVASCPLMAQLLAAMTKIEPVSRYGILGTVIGIGGISIVYQSRLDIPHNAVALGEVILATMCFAVANWALKRQTIRQEMSAVGTSRLKLLVAKLSMQGLISFVPTSLLLWLMYSFTDPSPMPQVLARPTAFLVYTTLVVSFAGYGVYIWLMHEVSLVAAVSITFFHPVIALVIDAVWETKALELSTYLGSLVVMFGVIFHPLAKSLAKFWNGRSQRVIRQAV